MSKSTDPYSQSLDEILHDTEFAIRWTYVRPRLANILIKGQLTYADSGKTDEQIGQFTAFTLRLLKLFDSMDTVIAEPKTATKVRPKLNPLQ